MTEYADKILMEAEDHFTGSTVTPAANHIFDVDPNSEKNYQNCEQKIFITSLHNSYFLQNRDDQTS